VIGAYGWIYSHWLAQPESDDSGIILPLVREHAISRGIIAPTEDVLGGGGTKTLSLTGLATRWGRGFDTVKRVIGDKGNMASSMRRGVSAAIPEHLAIRLETAWNSRLQPQAARDHLGIKRKALAGLVSSGILNRREDGTFDRSEVETLVERLVERDAGVGRQISLTAMARSGAGSVASLCGHILDGDIRAAALVRPPKQLGHVGLSADDVASIRAGQDLSVRGIARTLGLREDVTRFLSKTGVLSDRKDGRPTANGLVHFSRDFVTAIELGKRYEKSPRAAWLQLRDLAVLPAFGPPRCRQIIYRRADAERALLAAWLPPMRGRGSATERTLQN